MTPPIIDSLANVRNGQWTRICGHSHDPAGATILVLYVFARVIQYMKRVDRLIDETIVGGTGARMRVQVMRVALADCPITVFARDLTIAKFDGKCVTGRSMGRGSTPTNLETTRHAKAGTERRTRHQASSNEVSYDYRKRDYVCVAER